MRSETVLLEAKFDSKLPNYWMFNALLVLFFSVIGIPFIPFWLVLGWSFHKKQYERLSCTLTERSLNVKRGVVFRVEKNIPLDKIQDVGMKEGPLLRKLGLASLSIETAGQSATPSGADAALVGIVDSPKFRDAILDQRDLIVSSGGAAPVATEPVAGDETVLVEIRDSLKRIEGMMRERQG